MEGEMDLEAIERAMQAGDMNALNKLTGGGGGKKGKNEFDELEAMVHGMDEEDGGDEHPGQPKQTSAHTKAMEDELEQYMRDGVVGGSKKGGGMDMNMDMMAMMEPKPKPKNQIFDAPKPTQQAPPRPAANAPAPAPKPKVDPTEAIKRVIEQEKEYQDTSQFLSLAAIDAELKTIAGICSSAQLSTLYKDFASERRGNLEKMRHGICTDIASGKLDSNKYLVLINGTFKKNMETAKKAKANGVKDQMQKVMVRATIIEKEINEVKANPNYLKKFKDSAGMGSQLGGSGMKPAADKGSHYKEDVAKSLGASDYAKMKPAEKIELILTRKQKFKNLASFLFANFSEQRRHDIQTRYIPMLEKATAMIDIIQSGRDQGPVDEYLARELREVSPTDLFGGDMKDREAELKKLQTILEHEKEHEEKQAESLKAIGKLTVIKKKEFGEKVEAINDNIQKVLMVLKTPWIAVPKYIVTQETRALVKVNPDIPGNMLKVTFKKLQNATDKDYLIRFSVDCTTHIVKGEVPLKKEGNTDTMIQVSSDPAQPFKEIHKKSLEVVLIAKGWFSNDVYAQGLIDMAGFALDNTLSGTLTMPHKERDVKLDYCLQTKEPSGRGKIKVDVATIEKWFPAFNPNANLEEAKQQAGNLTGSGRSPQAQQSPQGSQMKPAQQAPAPAPVPQQPATTAPKLVMKSKLKEDEMLKQIPPGEVPAGLTLDDIVNPDKTDLSSCVTFLEEYAGALEQLKQYFLMEGMRKEAKHAEQTWMRIQQECLILTRDAGNGAVTPEMYKERLETTLVKDKALSQFYKAKGLADRAAFIDTRINIKQNELQNM